MWMVWGDFYRTQNHHCPKRRHLSPTSTPQQKLKENTIFRSRGYIRLRRNTISLAPSIVALPNGIAWPNYKRSLGWLFRLCRSAFSSNRPSCCYIRICTEKTETEATLPISHEAQTFTRCRRCRNKEENNLSLLQADLVNSKKRETANKISLK